MFSVHDTWRLAMVGVMLVACGCAARKRPFGDVVERSQAGPTTVEAVAAAPAEQPAVAPVPQPAEPKPEAVEPKPDLAPVVPPAPVPPPQRVVDAVYSPVPVEVDAIGPRRDWPLSVALRPGGNVVAWPLYYSDISDEAPNDLWQIPIEPTLFLVDTALVPVKAILVPPWRKVIYSEVNDEGWQPARQ